MGSSSSSLFSLGFILVILAPLWVGFLVALGFLYRSGLGLTGLSLSIFLFFVFFLRLPRLWLPQASIAPAPDQSQTISPEPSWLWKESSLVLVEFNTLNVELRKKGGPSTRLKSFETKHCRIAYPIIANFNQFIPILESELVQFRGQSVQICNTHMTIIRPSCNRRPLSPDDFLHTIQFISQGTLENVLHLEHELPNEWNVPDRYYLFYILGKMITCRPPSPPIHFFLIILLSVGPIRKG